MSQLGNQFAIHKSLNRHSRTETTRAGNEGMHYTDNIAIIMKTYSNYFKNSIIIDSIFDSR
jgi:hypothetical protein